MFQHRMQHRRHGWKGGPWGDPREARGADGRGRHFGPGGFNAADPELRSLIGDMRDLGQYLFQQVASGALSDGEKVGQLRQIIGRTRVEIETLFGPDLATTV